MHEDAVRNRLGSARSQVAAVEAAASAAAAAAAAAPSPASAEEQLLKGLAALNPVAGTAELEEEVCIIIIANEFFMLRCEKTKALLIILCTYIAQISV